MSDSSLPTSPDQAPSGPSLIHRIVTAALGQPLLVLIFSLVVVGAGVWSFTRLPVDAYPDISPPIVDIITQWPGHAAEEVERLITVPLENEMNGVERLRVERSVSLFGLSDVSLTFTDRTDPYFARQRVFERIADAELPDGVSPSVEPLMAPSGLIYRYVLDSPDRSAMDLKVINDWVLAKAYKGVPGVAEMSGLGGETMEYQVVVDPIKLAGAGLGIGDLVSTLGANNAQRRRRLLRRRGAVLLRPRARPGRDARRHRQGGPQGRQREAGHGEGHRPGGDRPRAPAGSVRVQ